MNSPNTDTSEVELYVLVSHVTGKNIYYYINRDEIPKRMWDYTELYKERLASPAPIWDTGPPLFQEPPKVLTQVKYRQWPNLLEKKAEEEIFVCGLDCGPKGEVLRWSGRYPGLYKKILEGFWEPSFFYKLWKGDIWMKPPHIQPPSKDLLENVVKLVGKDLIDLVS